MFTTAATAAVLAMSALAPTTMAATTTTTDATTASDVIEVVVFRNESIPSMWGGSFTGWCPSSHPYLYDEFYAWGRLAPHGVKVVSDTMVASHTATKEGTGTPVDPSQPYREAYWGGIVGDYLNWELRTAAMSVTLVCTSDTAKAWKGPQAERP